MTYTASTVSAKYSLREALCQHSVSEENCQCSTTTSVTITITTHFIHPNGKLKLPFDRTNSTIASGILYSRYSALSPQNRICLATQIEQTATVHPHRQREKQKKDQREMKRCSSCCCLPAEQMARAPRTSVDNASPTDDSARRAGLRDVSMRQT